MNPKTKLAILGAIELVEMADKRSRAGLRPIPPTVAEVKTIMARTEQIKRRNKMAEYARMGVVVGGIALLGYAALSD